MNSSSLYVFQSQDDADNIAESDEHETFIIEEELSNLNSREIFKIYGTLSDFDLEVDAPLPLYDFFWRIISITKQTNPLPIAILLAQRLQTIIKKGEIDTVICNNIDDEFEVVVADAAATCNINFVSSEDDPEVPAFSISSILRNNTPFFLDLFLSSLLSTRGTERGETVIIGTTGRFNSIAPVLDHIKNYEVIFPEFSISLYQKRRKAENPATQGLSIHRFTSLSTVGLCLIVYFRIILNIVWRKVEDPLVDAVESQYNIKMEYTISYLLRGAYSRNLPRVLYACIIKDVISETNPSNIIVPAMSPGMRAVLYGAHEEGVDTFYIPHSVQMGLVRAPPSYTTMFVEGKIANDYAEDTGQLANTDHMCPTGRPYLTSLYDETSEARRQKTSSDGSPLRIMIATQTYGDRLKLVMYTLFALQNIDTTCEVVIKVHPNENKTVYKDFLRSSEFENIKSINITKSNLTDHLICADLTATINSNVGLEAIIAGGATIVVNPDPTVLDAPYAALGPIPILEDKQECGEYFSDLSTDKLVQMQDEQLSFVEKKYVLEPGAAEDIGEKIL